MAGTAGSGPYGGRDQADGGGTPIPESAYAADHGEVPEPVAAALADYRRDPGALPELLGTLQRSRLLVPVVAVAGDDPDPGSGEKDSAMATVLVRGRDGRLALLAFTGTSSLAAWDASARPVPVPAAEAARAAIAEQAAAMVIDVAGPVPVVVEGEDLQGFAQEWTLARVGNQSAWVR